MQSKALTEILDVIAVLVSVPEDRVHDAVSLLGVLTREELAELGRATGTTGLSRLSKSERVNLLRSAILSSYYDGR